MQYKSSRILARDQTISNDTWVTGLNNNDLIIGPSGAGKKSIWLIARNRPMGITRWIISEWPMVSAMGRMS